MTRHSPIIVAGGGIGGLAAALGIARAGYAVRVFERTSAFGEIGAGIQLGPNAFHALKSLGLAESTLAMAVYIDRLVMMDGISGEQIAAIDVGEAFRAHFKNPYVVIHRADLHSPLLQACKGHPNIELNASTEVTGYSQDGDSVEVQLANGARVRGLALVGADGLRSNVRKQMIGETASPLRIYGHTSYRAVVPVEDMPEDLRWNAATIWVGPKTHMVHYPLRGWKLFNLVATFHGDRTTEGHNEPGDRGELLSHFAHLPPKPRAILEKPKEWRRWVLGDRDPVDNWIDGRVVLLGDAAHPTLQYFAQGACMALEDAACLTEKLNSAQGDIRAAFLDYQDARVTRTARIVLSSRELGRLYHAAGVERRVRNEIFNTKSQEDFYRGLEWIYGYGRDAATSN